MILSEAIEEVRRLSSLLEEGLKVLRQASYDVAEAEREYRKAKSLAWLEVEGTAGERAAHVDAKTADLRFERDVQEGLRRAAIESVRARTTQISMYQTLVNAHRAEAELAGKGPQ